MNSFVTDVWCDTCHNGPETNDFYLRDIFENGTGGFGLSLTHKSPKCSLQDCLNTCLGSKCDESNDRFKVTDSGYFHNCKKTDAKRQTYFNDIPSGKEKLLILQLADRCECNISTILEPDQIARPTVTIDLTRLVKHADRSGINVFGDLSGYITRSGGYYEPTGPRNDRVSYGHFCSVTKCRRTGKYYLSDNLNPKNVIYLGYNVNENWPVPYILFYTVKCFKSRERLLES